MQMLLPDGSHPKACATSAVICDVAVPHASRIVAALCEAAQSFFQHYERDCGVDFYQARFAMILR
jgi:hypothetical protein